MENENLTQLAKDLKLTEKQQTFCELFVQLANKREAYEQAGYKCTKETAFKEATRMLKNPKIKKYVDAITEAKHDALIADKDEVLRFYTRVMRGKEKDAFGLDPSLQDRLKAADQLAKRYQLFSNKIEVDGGQQQMIVQFVDDLVVDDLDE